jgi:YidC/Oxa1 family membrane protein insertase
MCQQFYVIRNNPAPNTSAFAAKQERMAKKAARKGEPVEATTTDAVDPATGHVPDAEAPAPAPRQQPKKQPRSQRKKPAPQQARKSGPTNAPKNAPKNVQKKPQQKRPGNQPKK